ncbi:glycosyltransferase family 4 protein [Streptomyces sp. NPDC050617]|uniref:glycosyltransferase family 4 protein n=1 Tax=Streptomyces sp. NPDC050617 TaxID=3154628 RepID=UPI0034211AD3
MKISFLIQNAYGIGGTIRSTFNVAAALAARHDVEIVSVYRTQAAPRLTLHPKVRLVSLLDKRPDVSGNIAEDPLLEQPTALIPPIEAKGAQFNALTDRTLADHLARTDADVVVATRPGLVIYLAEYGQSRYLRIGQEHRIYGTHEANIRAAQDAAIPHLDAHTTVSEADAATHRAQFPGVKTKLIALPNGVPASDIEPSDGSAKLVVAAGRLIPVKQYHVLVDAWAKVAAQRPDWKLRIYGRGPEHAALRTRIDGLGLNEHITLMGAQSPIETEWAKGSIAAVTSREESFGMTIVEAMHCAVPVVATDCPHGPGEIIDDGKDGLLVPVGDPEGIAKGLLKLIEDDDLRQSMGRAAALSAQRYAPEHIAARYERLIEELRGGNEEQKPATVPLSLMLRRTAGKLVRPFRRSATSNAVPVKSAIKDIVRKPLRPTASTRIDADGNIVVLVARQGLTGEDLTLTLTRRGEDDTVSIPLATTADATAPYTAVLTPHELSLAEGRWDLHVVRADDGARRRVASTFAEGRGLLGKEPHPGTPFTWAIPYPTVDGNLSLRAWRRTAHAEARTLRTEPAAFTVEGTLHGAAFAPDSKPHVTAAPRGESAAQPFTAEVTVADETRFSFTVPYEQVHKARAGATDESPVWDLSLRLAPGAPLIRIGRIIGDIVDRNKTDIYPTTAGVRPYITMASNLAVNAPNKK